jgi:hypothetical protein
MWAGKEGIPNNLLIFLNLSFRIAYVEFYTPESVLLAMGLSGTQFMGQTIMIQAS